MSLYYLREMSSEDCVLSLPHETLVGGRGRGGVGGVLAAAAR